MNWRDSINFGMQWKKQGAPKKWGNRYEPTMNHPARQQSRRLPISISHVPIHLVPSGRSQSCFIACQGGEGCSPRQLVNLETPTRMTSKAIVLSKSIYHETTRHKSTSPCKLPGCSNPNPSKLIPDILWHVRTRAETSPTGMVAACPRTLNFICAAVKSSNLSCRIWEFHSGRIWHGRQLSTDQNFYGSSHRMKSTTKSLDLTIGHALVTLVLWNVERPRIQESDLTGSRPLVALSHSFRNQPAFNTTSWFGHLRADQVPTTLETIWARWRKSDGSDFMGSKGHYWETCIAPFLKSSMWIFKEIKFRWRGLNSEVRRI